MHPMLINAVKAARRAGGIINRASQDVGSLKIHSKTYNDFVSEVDHACEQAIIETLKEAYPDHGFWVRKLVKQAWMRSTSGLLIHLMAPPIFCMVFLNMRFLSPA